MKDQISAFELKYMVDELQVLLDSRVNQIYQPKGLLLQFHKTGEGKRYLRIEPNALWLVEEKQEMTGKIPGLCQALRKYIKGKKVTKIGQIGSERIVFMELETQKEKYNVYVELFGSGNIILTDGENKIIRAIEEREWKDRMIKSGEEYRLPPAKANIFKLTEKDFEGKEEKGIALMGFGKLYAKEILTRSKDAFKGYKSLMNSKKDPHVYGKEAVPILLEQEEDGQKYETFSKAISAVWVDETPKKKETKKDKIIKQILMQEKNIEDQQKKAEELQRKGELIYEHYQEVKEAIDKAKGPNIITIDLE